MNKTRLNDAVAEKAAVHRLGRDEMETTYLIDAADNAWKAYSTIPRDIHRLEKQGWTCIETQLYPDGSVMSKSFTAPRNCLSPRSYNPDKPKKAGRVLTEDQKQKMQEARKAKNNVD